MDLLQTLWRNLLVSLDIVAALAALFLIVYLGIRHAQRHATASSELKGLDTWLIVGVLLGGRAGAVIPEISIYLGSPLDLIRVNFGLSLYGAIGGGALALAFYGMRRWQLTVSLADVFALYLALGIGLFHVGCLMYGFCGGKPAEPPLGIPLPGHVGLRYPSELYEGILMLGLFFALLRLSERGLPLGTVTGLFLIVYPVVQTIINLTRFSSGPWPWADDAVSLSFVAVGLIIFLLVWVRRRHSRAAGGSPKVS